VKIFGENINERRAMKKLKTATLPAIVPRNPLVAAAKFRKAGSHRDSRKTERQKAAQQLQRILKNPADAGFLHIGTPK
jgi:hypothetical protein